ncbi:vacuolar protein sorting-associated protein 37a-like [Plakobranchus ocellatus]|uniref:Vacuolar protein sorting-associated protein 37a-like n=1 Tax=Plakobranchus ocellatus TaxID=259542 RepID=A0AAV3YIH1_9GAST|nr:vacuolar protein sorting-associated protein 37a-like [Plakobranchus ocellatus]
MNRLFGGGKKGPTGSATNLQVQKSRQIESLRKVGAIEILRDVEYRVIVPHNNTNLTIQITLPAQFPGERPVLTIQPAVNHPWVDAQMKVVGCPSLNNFSMHSDLGQTVQAVLDEFKKTPPIIVPQHYILGFNKPTISQTAALPAQGSALSSFPGQLPLPYPNNQPPVMPPPNFQGNQPLVIPPPLPPRRPPIPTDAMADSNVSSSFSMPNILNEFPSLKDMKLYELQELAEDEDRIHEMVQKVPDLVNFIQQREDLSVTCVQLAQSNLQMKPRIESLKSEIMAKNSELESLKSDFEQHCGQHMALSEQFHPSHIQTNLKVAVMEADEESENIAEKFLEKDIDVDEFVKSFMEKRTLCYLRRAKEEKLNHIALSQGHRF